MNIWCCLAKRAAKKAHAQYQLHHTQYNTQMQNEAQRRNVSVWRLLRHYALDWVLAIVIYALGSYFGGGGRKGFRRRFDINDTSIQFPFAEHERVTTLQLYLISVLSPTILIPIISLLTPERGFADIHAGLLALAFSVSLDNSATNLIKVLIGRTRPDMLDRCKPDLAIVKDAIRLFDDSVCTVGEGKRLSEGFRSFPSGHSSLSFAGLGLLTLFLAGKVNLWRHIPSGTKGWFCVVPLAAATLVAVSRVMDYRHHPTDVIAGGLLGLVVAYASYRRYYPSLDSPRAHQCWLPGELVPVEGDNGRGVVDGMGRSRGTWEDNEASIGLTSLRGRPDEIGREGSETDRGRDLGSSKQ